MKTRIAILSIFVSCMLTGCAREKRGGSLWPEYRLPDEITFTDTEKIVIADYARQHPEVFYRIQGQIKSLRAMLRKHNEHAREHNNEVLKGFGLSREALSVELPESEREAPGQERQEPERQE